ncbi:hypothetical protein BGW80DRAFT_1514339 [Lactifluus volemus]|nr:hypothetical protein BGW80DRAFT_1514339 [Lactifluus volemus]
MDHTANSPPIQGKSRKPRSLVLCFDGTANEFSKHNTNVVKLYSILKKDRPDVQLCYYQECALHLILRFGQAGVGTYFQPGVVSPFFRFAARILDEALAWYLSEHIMDGYKFLMQNYHEGDSVSIFGFSRGAYTARALAGMLHKVGLLSKDNFEQVAFAYRLYKSSSRKDNKLAARFKRSFSREVPIDFLGVWDTVASVGLFSNRTLPFVGTNNTIRVFRQALSLDECRAKFCPNLYHRPVVTPSPARPRNRPLYERIWKALKGVTRPRRSRDTPHSVHDLESRLPRHRTKLEFKKDVKEVWFAGAHSDVGGGLVDDMEKYALSNIPLRWMVREILEAGSHIRFDEATVAMWNIPIALIEETPVVREVNASVPRPSSPTESSLDAEDAVQKMGNSFKKNPLWWILEIIPTYYEWQNETGKWVGNWRFHLGRGRQLPARPLFHESVKIRMDNPGLNYSPRALYEKGTEEYVV